MMFPDLSIIFADVLDLGADRAKGVVASGTVEVPL
jgi:hypothetical protein